MEEVVVDVAEEVETAGVEEADMTMGMEVVVVEEEEEEDAGKCAPGL